MQQPSAVPCMSCMYHSSPTILSLSASPDGQEAAWQHCLRKLFPWVDVSHCWPYWGLIVLIFQLWQTDLTLAMCTTRASRSSCLGFGNTAGWLNDLNDLKIHGLDLMPKLQLVSNGPGLPIHVGFGILCFFASGQVNKSLWPTVQIAMSKELRNKLLAFADWKLPTHDKLEHLSCESWVRHDLKGRRTEI